MKCVWNQRDTEGSIGSLREKSCIEFAYSYQYRILIQQWTYGTSDLMTSDDPPHLT